MTTLLRTISTGLGGKGSTVQPAGGAGADADADADAASAADRAKLSASTSAASDGASQSTSATRAAKPTLTASTAAQRRADGGDLRSSKTSSRGGASKLLRLMGAQTTESKEERRAAREQRRAANTRYGVVRVHDLSTKQAREHHAASILKQFKNDPELSTKREVVVKCTQLVRFGDAGGTDLQWAQINERLPTSVRPEFYNSPLMPIVEKAVERFGTNSVAVLSVANPVDCGGGFRAGDTGLEESLCHVSPLYYSLESQQSLFYAENAKQPASGLFQNHFIYTYRLPVICSTLDGGVRRLSKEEQYTLSVLSVPAPYARQCEARGVSDEQIEATIRMRLSAALIYARWRRHRFLITACWGCGTLAANKPVAVARAFFKAIMDNCAFDAVFVCDRDVETLDTWRREWQRLERDRGRPTAGEPLDIADTVSPRRVPAKQEEQQPDIELLDLRRPTTGGSEQPRTVTGADE